MSSMMCGMLLGAGVSAKKTYVDDIFSTFLYTGQGGASNTTITNGINLSGDGGMVWTKGRSAAKDHMIIDTVRGSNKRLFANENSSENTASSYIQAFNNNGYSVGSDDNLNGNGVTTASWTFRKAPGFFDIVTYTGNGTAGRTVSHNLGCVPGIVIVKRLDASDSWAVYHKDTGATKHLYLNNTNSVMTSASSWNDTAPTSSVITLGSDGRVNDNGGSYVAYLFAHDEQSFGEDENASAIKCGSYTGNGSSTGPTIDLGWEPQWLLIKNATGTTNWRIVDSMRGIVTGGNDQFLTPDLNEAEWDNNKIDLTSTGFKITASNGDVNENGDTIIYVAIRRPDGYVGKPPSLGTDVFAMDTATNNFPAFDSNFIVDMSLNRVPGTSSGNWELANRLTTGDATILRTNSNVAEYTWSSPYYQQDSNAGWGKASSWQASPNYQSWMWKRHAGFDVVAYTGTGSTRQISHSLNKTPEMIWVKRRNAAAVWRVYHKGLNGGSSPEGYNLNLNNDNAEENATTIWTNAPTSTNFSVGTHASTNQDDDTYIAMLFASVDGISKVGYYDGSDSVQTITTGFQPRFLMIKRVNTTGHWYVIDTIRGWASGNDPFLKLNSNSSQTSDTEFGAPTSTGFTLDGNHFMFNDAGDKFIYYAHA